MSDVTIRLSSAQDDLCAMRSLWRAAFHDTDEIINAFFDCLYAPGSAVLALENGKTVGCVYLLPGAAQDETEFLFLRFNGTMPEEAQG